MLTASAVRCQFAEQYSLFRAPSCCLRRRLGGRVKPLFHRGLGESWDHKIRVFSTSETLYLVDATLVDIMFKGLALRLCN